MAEQPVLGQTSLRPNTSTAQVAQATATGELGPTQKAGRTPTSQSSTTTTTARQTTVQFSRRGKKQDQLFSSEQF